MLSFGGKRRWWNNFFWQRAKNIFLIVKLAEDNFMFHDYDYTVKYAEIILCTMIQRYWVVLNRSGKLR